MSNTQIAEEKICEFGGTIYGCEAVKKALAIEL